MKAVLLFRIHELVIVRAFPIAVLLGLMTIGMHTWKRVGVTVAVVASVGVGGASHAKRLRHGAFAGVTNRPLPK